MMSVAPIDDRLERICIGLFALYDDLSVEAARLNWNAGFGYGAEVSRPEIIREAKIIEAALDAVDLTFLEAVRDT